MISALCFPQAMRLRYEHDLVQIMNQFGVHNEAEIVSGCISKFARHRRKKGDVKQMIMDAVHALRRKFLRCALNGPIMLAVSHKSQVERSLRLSMKVPACNLVLQWMTRWHSECSLLHAPRS